MMDDPTRYEAALHYFGLLSNDELLMGEAEAESESIAIIKLFPTLWKALEKQHELRFFIKLCPIEHERKQAEAKLFMDGNTLDG